MKRFLCILLALSMCAMALCSCSQEPAAPAAAEPAPAAPAAPAPAAEPAAPAPAPESNVKLTFMSNMVGYTSETLEAVCKDYTAMTGVEIEYIAPGASYEEIMKTKMASKDLPDLWTTHGWSVVRYGEYLRPLNDQPFFNDLQEGIKGVITAPNGDVYVLPINIDMAGIIYNATVLEKSGVNPDDIKTWADYEAACDKVKAAGFIPMHIGGKDSWTIGQFFDWVAPSFYITNDASNDRAAFKDGSFDWTKWADLCNMFKKWFEAGYFNVDCLTSDYLTGAKAYADDKVAFGLYGNNVPADALSANPNVKMGFMPVPALTADDQPTLIGGERLTVGVWKESPNEEAALAFVNYLATPDVMKKIAEADGLPAGLKGIDVDTGMLKPCYDKYGATARVFPYFDREYLPNGMWDDLCITGAGILSGDKNAVANAVEQMQTSYTEKFNQQ